MEPYGEDEVRELVKSADALGNLLLSLHAEQRMRERKISRAEVLRSAKHGVLDTMDFLDNSWRYGMFAGSVLAVVTFPDEGGALIVTAIRK